ncbi:MAG: hypothetical protein IKN87_05595 [Bacilli bacterium]|nr:hypothetical protein [Bacilli bacterium]
MKSVIITALISPILLLIFYLVKMDFRFATYVCKICNILEDLAITVMSPGFANNIIILSLVFEFGLGCWLITKLTKTKLFNNIKNFIENLIF